MSNILENYTIEFWKFWENYTIEFWKFFEIFLKNYFAYKNYIFIYLW